MKTAVEWLVEQLIPKAMQMNDPITVNVIAEAKKMEKMQMSNAVGQSESLEQSQKLDQVLESKEVQEILGVSIGTLQNLRNNGTIPFFKLGGKIKYRRSDILNLIK